MTLASIIARIEAGETGRELGRLALLAGGWTETERGYWMGPLTYWTPPDPKYGRGFDGDDLWRHNPLTDLNAAVSLVLRGWTIKLYRGFDDDGEYYTSVKLTNSLTVERGNDPEDEVSVSARLGAPKAFVDPTAAALTCAALKSRIEQ